MCCIDNAVHILSCSKPCLFNKKERIERYILLRILNNINLKENIMPVTLSFGNHQNYTLNESRLAHLLSADKEKAIHMGAGIKSRIILERKKGPCAGSVTLHHSRAGPW